MNLNIKEFFKNLFKKKSSNFDEIKNLNIKELLQYYKYPFETHSVETKDGYILTLFRLGKKNSNNFFINSQPVLFQHGILDSSDGWLCNYEERCFPFLFSDLGFDVWLSNSRGNKYSKSHIKYTPKDFEFWQFSFNELGLYDIPSILEYINNNNNSKEKIIYIGHSQGTCMLFSALCQNCEYFANRIKLFIALAPIARLNNMSSFLLLTLEKLKIVKTCNKLGICEMFPSGDNESNFDFVNIFNKYFMPMNNFTLSFITDNNSKDTNDQEYMELYKKFFPSGCSLNCLSHFAHIINKKKFCYFDYGKIPNYKIYGSVEPPEYDLSKIKNIPIILICGEEDKLATPPDVEWLNEQIKENVIYFKIIPKIGHTSFLIGNDISWFEDVMEIILTKYVVNNNNANYY